MPDVDLRELIAIFGGGLTGAIARAALAQTVPSSPTSWPWVTFAVNILGAFVLGYATTRLQERLPLSAYRRPFLGTGFCGALTTFSTMQLELVKMVEARDIPLAVGYACASAVAGFLAVMAATAMVRRVRVLV